MQVGTFQGLVYCGKGLNTLNSTMAAGLVSGGPVSLIYGAMVAFIGSLCSAMSLAELASRYNRHLRLQKLSNEPNYLAIPLPEDSITSSHT